jgi:hypothetical protein
MPLFPELQLYLEANYREIVDADDFDPKAVKLSEQPVIRRYRDCNANLRTQLLRIIKRAGLTAWPKLFQNLGQAAQPNWRLSIRYTLRRLARSQQ